MTTRPLIFTTVCSTVPRRLVLRFWCKGKQADGKDEKESSVLIFEEGIGFVFTPCCVWRLCERKKKRKKKNLSCRLTCFVLQNQSSRQTLFLYNIHFITFYRIKLVSIKWERLLVFCHVQWCTGARWWLICLGYVYTSIMQKEKKKKKKKNWGWKFGVERSAVRMVFERLPPQCGIPSCSAFLNASSTVNKR